MEIINAVLWITGAVVVGLLVGALFVWIRMRLRKDAMLMQKDRELTDLKLQHQREIEAARKQSVNQSRSTIKGQIGEQLAPLLPGFAYAASDACFLGSPVDYVVFNGYTAFRDSPTGAATDVEVVILDIKRGASKLTIPERAVAEAVEAGRVRFEVVRMAEDGAITTERYTCQRRR